MERRAWLPTLVTFLAVTANLAAQEGRLQKVRNAVDGVGESAARMMSDLGNARTNSNDTDFGVNVHLGFDLACRQPWIFSTSADLGNLGSAFVVHGRATLGYLWNRCEFLGGYDYLSIGGVSLQGPLAGIRLWF